MCLKTNKIKISKENKIIFRHLILFNEQDNCLKYYVVHIFKIINDFNLFKPYDDKIKQNQNWFDNIFQMTKNYDFYTQLN